MFRNVSGLGGHNQNWQLPGTTETPLDRRGRKRTASDAEMEDAQGPAQRTMTDLPPLTFNRGITVTVLDERDAPPMPRPYFPENSGIGPQSMAEPAFVSSAPPVLSSQSPSSPASPRYRPSVNLWREQQSPSTPDSAPFTLSPTGYSPDEGRRFRALSAPVPELPGYDLHELPDLSGMHVDDEAP